MTAAISIENSNSALHGSLLLKAIRMIYNIFLTSRSTQVQTVAQATLSQISTTIFNRIPSNYNFTEIIKGHENKMQGGNSTIKRRISRMLLDKNKF
jgi:hypothetical protein